MSRVGDCSDAGCMVEGQIRKMPGSGLRDQVMEEELACEVQQLSCIEAEG